MAFETLFDASNATVFKFEERGAKLEGHYMGSFDFEGDYGPTKKHVFSTPTGAVVIFGQRHLIQTLPTVKPGTMVRITYNDDLAPKAKGRQPMKLFKFEQDKKNTIEVAGVELTPTAPTTETGNFEQNFEQVDTNVTDDIPPTRATKPASPARTPSAEQQAAVRATFAKR